MPIFLRFDYFEVAEILHCVFSYQIAVFRVIVSQNGRNVRATRFAGVIDTDSQSASTRIADCDYNLRALGQLNSLKYLTGSRKRLSELCVSRESRTSDFWRIFHDPPFTLGCFTEDHLATFLTPFADQGVTLSGGAKTELLNWSGGVPLLATVLCNWLWDGASNGSALSNESVNAVAESLLASNSDTVNDLWRSFDGEQQRLLAEIATGTEPLGDVGVLRPLADAGVIVSSKRKFILPSKILSRYAAGEYGRVGSGMQKIFGDRDSFNRNKFRRQSGFHQAYLYCGLETLPV